MSVKRNSINSSTVYSRVYDSLSGVDFCENRKREGNRYAYLENMYIDYEGEGGIESIPGFRILKTFPGKINGIFSQKYMGDEYIIVHAGTCLYRFNIEDRDSSEIPTAILEGLADAESTALVQGESLYIIDGKKIAIVEPEGTAGFAGSSSYPAYIPTTHMNGEPYEAQNLLTQKFYQRFILSSPDEYAYGTPGLTYTITDYDARECAVSGVSSSVSGAINIPCYTVLGGMRFKVKTIADSAFDGNTAITSLITNEGLISLGYRSLAACTALTSVVLSKTVEEVGDSCFQDSTALTSFYFGDNFKKFGEYAFQNCTSLRRLYYSKSSSDLENIENTLAYEDRAVYCNRAYKSITLKIPVIGEVSTIRAVTLDEANITYTYSSSENAVLISHSNRDYIEGRNLEISGLLKDGTGGFLDSELGSRLSHTENIYSCKKGTQFDGRLFLTANPNLPGVIFYSGVDKNGVHQPLYFSTENYITENAGGSAVTSLFTVSDGLIATLAGSGGGGSIFLHAPEGEGYERSYPAEQFAGGVSGAGDGISFMGEPIFVSSLGICSTVRDTSKDFVGISCRSQTISKQLLSESTDELSLTEWQGYIVASAGGRIYLGDSRDSFKSGNDYAYEWYYLSGIGTYQNDTAKYKYLSVPKDGYYLSPFPDEDVTAEVYSEISESEETNYYTYELDKKYAVYPTGERSGGDFYPATIIKGIGDLLFFGTDLGDLCVFNSDKRGTPPPYISEKADFDSEEYEYAMGRKIHPYYYSFDDHGVKYTIVTPADNGELPDLEKSTVGKPAIKLGNPSSADIDVVLRTDRAKEHSLCKIHSGKLDFSEIDFSHFSFCTSEYSTFATDEVSRGFIEKQYIISSEGFRAPISFCSVSYRYKAKGNIKNK